MDKKEKRDKGVREGRPLYSFFWLLYYKYYIIHPYFLPLFVSPIQKLLYQLRSICGDD
jgi:hypothetical protein